MTLLSLCSPSCLVLAQWSSDMAGTEEHTWQLDFSLPGGRERGWPPLEPPPTPTRQLAHSNLYPTYHVRTVVQHFSPWPPFHRSSKLSSRKPDKARQWQPLGIISTNQKKPFHSKFFTFLLSFLRLNQFKPTASKAPPPGWEFKASVAIVQYASVYLQVTKCAGCTPLARSWTITHVEWAYFCHFTVKNVKSLVLMIVTFVQPIWPLTWGSSRGASAVPGSGGKQVFPRNSIVLLHNQAASGHHFFFIFGIRAMPEDGHFHFWHNSQNCISEEDNHTHFGGKKNKQNQNQRNLESNLSAVCLSQSNWTSLCLFHCVWKHSAAHEPEEPLGLRAVLDSTRDVAANQQGERKAIDNWPLTRADETHWLCQWFRLSASFSIHSLPLHFPSNARVINIIICFVFFLKLRDGLSWT